MRLSLKTILAYVDRLFDAEYQPAVEKRIIGEEASARLIERVQNLICAADLSVPGRIGEKEELPPNLVAAYLDHQLSEAEQTQFESICLRSDVFLAETACAHQILTSALGQPARINRDCRLRLYAIPKRHKNLHASAAAREQLPSVDDEQNASPDQSASNNISTIMPKDAQETEPTSRKKHRITVISQGPFKNVETPNHSENDQRPEMPDSPLSAETDKHIDIRFVADAVKQGEVPPERLDYYTTEEQFRPDTARIPVPAADKNRRLGQAFEQLKRRRQVMMVFSLLLLAVCVSAYLFSGQKTPQNDHLKGPIIASPQKREALPDDEKSNDERLAASHALWGGSGQPSRQAPKNEVPATTAYAPDSVYLVNERPESVLNYMPGENHSRQVAGLQQTNVMQPEMATVSPPATPLVPATGTVMTAMTSPPSTPYLAHAPMPDATINSAPGMRSNSTIGLMSGHDTSFAQQQPGGFTPTRHEQQVMVASQNNAAQVNETEYVFHDQSNARGSISDSSRLASGQSITNASFDRSRRQPGPELTMQLIHRGSAPSVDRYLNNTLPAVQPAMLQNEHNPGQVPPENNSNDQSVFVISPVRTNPMLYSNASALMPQYRNIEQVSYVAAQDRPYPMLPPLIEPAWNETDNGDFESMPELPRLGNITHDAPAEMPGFQSLSDTPMLTPISNPRENSSGDGPTSAATLPLPVQPAHNGNHASEQPLRFPENMAASNRLAHLPSRGRDSRDFLAESAMLLLGTDDLALIRDNPENEWSWLPVSRELRNDIVLVPAPFQAVIRFANGIVVKTEGDTRIQILPEDAEGHPAIAFDCGHLTISATRNSASNGGNEQSYTLRIVTPVGGGVLRLVDEKSFVQINSENKTMVKLLRVKRSYESVTHNAEFYTANIRDNVLYCPNLITCPAKNQTVFWKNDGNHVEWDLATTAIFPIDTEKNTGPIFLHDAANLAVTPAVVWPALVSHDGNIPISKLDLKNQFVTMPHTFYPTPSKIWLLK